MIDVVVNGLELLWVMGALMGTYISLQSLRTAREDERHLVHFGMDGPRRIVARAAARRERLQLTTLVVFAFTGLIVLLGPWLLAWGLAGAGLAIGIRLVVCLAIGQIIAVSLLDRRDRDRLIRDMSLARKGESPAHPPTRG